MTAAEIALELQRRYGTEPDRARELAELAVGNAPGALCRDAAPRRSSRHVPPSPVLRSAALLADGGMMLVLGLAPRTKKNGRKGGFAGIKQGPAYRRYRDAIIDALDELRADGSIPLPDRPYNIAVTYVVDGHGKLADKCGLDQGLYDALENAGVVTNDWQFRTDDGTRIVAGDPDPRVEILITPLQELSNV